MIHWGAGEDVAKVRSLQIEPPGNGAASQKLTGMQKGGAGDLRRRGIAAHTVAGRQTYFEGGEGEADILKVSRGMRT